MEPTNTSRRQRPRHPRLIRPRLQLRLIGAFTAVTVLALLAQLLAVGAILGRTAEALPTGGDELALRVPAVLGRAMLLSFGLVLPALFLIGRRVTHKVAGPVYRFEEHLAAVARGEDPGECRIREGDELQELCDAINAALASERAREPMDPKEERELAA